MKFSETHETSQEIGVWGTRHLLGERGFERLSTQQRSQSPQGTTQPVARHVSAGWD
jgi:hypothetical protein